MSDGICDLNGAAVSAMRRIIDLAFERLAMRLSDLAELLGVSYGGAANTIAKLIAQGVADEVPGVYPKLIRSGGVEGFRSGVSCNNIPFFLAAQRNAPLTLDRMLSIIIPCKQSATRKHART